MVYRLSALGIVGAILLDLLRLQRLLRPTESAASWQIILIAAVILGGVITWVAQTYRVGRLGTLALNAGGMALAVLRIGAPETLQFGIIPTTATFAELAEEMSFALQLLRFGNAPVVPVVGLIVILALVFWAFGMLAVWGLNAGHPWVGTVPALMFYLQLSTIDRAPSTLPWILTFLVLTAMTIAGIAGEDRLKGTGRLRGVDGLAISRSDWTLPIIILIAFGAVSLLSSNVAADRVPESGVLDWRSRSGLGDGIYGGVSYNLYTGIVQDSLLSLSDEPVFVARVSDSDLKPNEMYWRLVTLDAFDGANWFLTNRGSRDPAAGDAWEGNGYGFRGPTTTVDQIVQIRSLKMNYLPVIYAPAGLTSETDIVMQSLRVRDDASIRFDALTREGLTYRVRSEVPRPDINVLATSNGSLSPVFDTASESSAFTGQAATTPPMTDPEDIDDFLELPDDLDVRLLALARDITLDASGDFEQAIFLERFFRNTGPGGFTYSVDIEPGHSAENLADWLDDPESPNYRTGYCEQFATSLAVLARILDIPSRVVIGFTPGEVQDDDSIIVRQRNAHSWVELWMDGQGWVQFDPTPRRSGDNPSTVDNLVGFDPTLYIPVPEDFDENVELDADGNPIPFGPDRGEFLPQEDILDPNAPFVGSGDSVVGGGLRWQFIGMTVVAVLVLLIPAGKWVRRRMRLRRLQTGDISAAWEEIVDRLTDLRYDVSDWKTPAEVAATTEPSLTALAAVYGESVYGPSGAVGQRQIEIGRASFQSTETVLRHRHSRWQLIRSWLTPTSLRARAKRSNR